MKYINWQKTIELLLASLPGTILAYYFHDRFWLSASLIAVCVVIPVGTSHQNAIVALFHASCVFVLSILLYYNLAHWGLYLFILMFMGLIFAIIETDNPSFKEVSTWTFIATIYVSIRLHGIYNFHANYLWLLYVIILLSICLAILPFSRIPTIKIAPLILHHSKFLLYLKYCLPLCFSVLIWKEYHPPEVEWFIWASLSVLNLNYQEAQAKLQQRLWGGGAGILLGLMIIPLVPHSELISYVLYILILLSFRLFYKYLYCYFFRCLLITLFAGNDFQTMGKIRLMSIFVGGVLGVLCSWIIIQLNQFFQIYYCKNKNNITS
jgi:hypothetical protein